jgi:hypothetical protein
MALETGRFRTPVMRYMSRRLECSVIERLEGAHGWKDIKLRVDALSHRKIKIMETRSELLQADGDSEEYPNTA